MTKEPSGLVTVKDCQEAMSKCPGRGSIPLPIMIVLVLALAGWISGAYLINSARAQEIESKVTRIEAVAELRAEEQKEIRQDLKRVLQTVTEIKARLDQEDRVQRGLK